MGARPGIEQRPAPRVEGAEAGYGLDMELLVILVLVVLVAAVILYRWIRSRRDGPPAPPDHEGNPR